MAKSRSFWAGSIAEYLAEPNERILGAMALRVGQEYASDESRQITSWRRQLEILHEALAGFVEDHLGWGLLLELPLLRLGRRIDAVLLIGDRICPIEFKIGATKFQTNDIEQAVDYALCLRDFHGASRDKEIVPILCASDAPLKGRLGEEADCVFVDQVAACILTNAGSLRADIEKIAAAASGPQIDWRAFDASAYNPTPDIVTAARGVYAGHSVRDIGRSDANADALELTAATLRTIAEQARLEKAHVICFVTGEPGSGKTLLGLELVFASEAGRVAGEPAALLSGNRPLVRVLQEAIAIDANGRLQISMAEARRTSQQALQTLLGYLKDHSDANSPPPEHVIVFDEAQRAWDADTGEKLLGRRASEPELFLEILGRLDWACLVCLVGPGQEINRGEGGLGLWAEALNASKGKWKTFLSAEMLSRAGDASLQTLNFGPGAGIVKTPALHLETNLRAYRNEAFGKWVDRLLVGDLDAAATIAQSMPQPPAFLTRSLACAKEWLAARRRGSHRVGLLASSGAVRLIGEGLPFSPRSNELDSVVHWFLRPAGDYRSSNALEIPLSEFVCQGLEIDYAGLCWGNDLIWRDGSWVARRMRAPNWQIIRGGEAYQYRVNAYRVLLTRARAWLVIYIPEGDNEDVTRQGEDFEEIAEALLRAGCRELTASVEDQSPQYFCV